jgi:hypothetical protein
MVTIDNLRVLMTLYHSTNGDKLCSIGGSEVSISALRKCRQPEDVLLEPLRLRVGVAATCNSPQYNGAFSLQTRPSTE